jgi:ATP-dependent helicase HrpA
LTPEKYTAIHRALLTGFLSGIAQRTETGEYVVAGGMKSWLWPGSGLASKQPKWLVFAESVETTRRFLRTAARIDPAWIEPLAGELVTKTYSEPHWDAESLAVIAYEKVTLWGLPIVPRRRTRYSRIDPAECRRLFLQHGLVAADWPEPPEFLAHNAALIRDIEERQARQRQPALLRDEEDRLDFYARRIPDHISDGATLKHWLREHPSEARRLFMTEADVLHPEARPADASQFPDLLEIHGLKLPLTYQHDPGGANDGVTVTVPQAGLNQLNAAQLGWLVPGLLEEKVAALLRTLPKEHRRELSPIPETAKQLAAGLPFGIGELPQALAKDIEDSLGVKVGREEFDEARLPDYLRMQIEVVQNDGKRLAVGRDLVDLQRQFGAKAAKAFAAVDDAQWTKDGITTWNIGPLPESVPLERFGITLTGYPTLLDQGTSVALRLWDAPEKAGHELRFGLRRLFSLALTRELKTQVDHLPHLNAWTLLAKTFPQPLPLREQLADLTAERACMAASSRPRDQREFQAMLSEGRKRLSIAAAEVVHVVRPLFDEMTQVRRQWEKVKNPQFQPSLADEHDHLARLLSPGFLVRTPWHWLAHFPRYLQAVVRRLEKLPGGGHQRDQQQLPALQLRWRRCFERLKQHEERQIFDPELETYRWTLEEYRVLLFAQELGTAVSVSEKKLDKQWEIVKG